MEKRSRSTWRGTERYVCFRLLRLLYVSLTDLTTFQNLVTRGDQKPSAGGSGNNANVTSPSYDANHNVLSNPMDSSADSATDFAYGVGHADGQY